MTSEAISFKSGTHNLSGFLESPAKPVGKGVVLLHGLTNSKDDCPLIREVSQELSIVGCYALRFDFFGSGQSPGQLQDATWQSRERNARDAIRFLQSLGVTSIGLWGRSLGGVLAILCSDDPVAEAFVLASTPVFLKEVFVDRFRNLQLRQAQLEEQGKSLPGTGKYKGTLRLNESFSRECPVVERRLFRLLKGMSRVLVLATTPDSKVPLANVRAIIGQVQEPKQLHIYDGTEHDYRGVERDAVCRIVGWFDKYLSGA